jgi:hypothetical protein
MGIPDMTNRMKSAPLQALRTMFTGIGRILMSADRPDRVARTGRPENGLSNGSGHSRSGPAPALTPGQARWRSLDQTGNVRLLSAEDFEDGLDHRAGPMAPADADANAHAAAPVLDSQGPAELPLAAYDTLSLPSIRARLRGLDTAQLRVLLAYEQAHAERPEVLGMFERRIEKLAAGE